MFPKDHPAHGLPSELGAFHPDIFEAKFALNDGSTCTAYLHEGCSGNLAVDDLWQATIDGWLDELEVGDVKAATAREPWRRAELRRRTTEKMREKLATHIILTRRLTDGRGSLV